MASLKPRTAKSYEPYNITQLRSQARQRGFINFLNLNKKLLIQLLLGKYTNANHIPSIPKAKKSQYVKYVAKAADSGRRSDSDSDSDSSSDSSRAYAEDNVDLVQKLGGGTFRRDTMPSSSSLMVLEPFPFPYADADSDADADPPNHFH